MELNYRYSESTKKPAVVETTCIGTVFLRKDIHSEVRTDEQKNDVTYWCYQEAKMSSEEFASYITLLTSINAIKGINDSENIESIKTTTENNDDNQLTIMSAIADLYDLIAALPRG